MENPTKHIPVLKDEVLKHLQPRSGDKYLDLTAGYGGHALEVAKRVGSNGSITLVDRDVFATEHLKKAFSGASNVQIINADYLSASKDLLKAGHKYDVILADLGISSPHVDEADRGFSFNKEGPLDMRMNTSQELTAADIVNTYDEAELIRILREYGEEPRAKRIARGIIQHRPFVTTTQLAECIKAYAPKKRTKIHPATKLFQALRIAVNDELAQLELSLPIWIELLSAGGRIGVISFHSLEDRLVKQAFLTYGGDRYDATLQTVTKKPVIGSAEEVVFNPRARSAKLRSAQRK